MQNSGMNFNRITLDFHPSVERKFRDKYYTDSIISFKIAFSVVTLIYALFGILDTILVPEFAETFHIIRFGVVVPVLIACLIFSFMPVFRKIWQEFIIVCFVTGGTGISIMTILIPENLFYYAGLMLVFMAGYFFIKLRFIGASIGGWSVLLIYNIGAIGFSDTTGTVLLTTNFFFISANLIGMFAAYSIEFYARRDFILNLELDRQKREIEEANRTLEANIEKRTAELRIAKEKAVESDRLKSAFISNISHEIRTPLNGIIGFGQIITEYDLSREEKSHYLSVLKSSSDRLLQTITDYMDIARIVSGTQEISRSSFNVKELLEELVGRYREACDSKNLLLELVIPDYCSDAHLSSDRELVSKTLQQLIDNAIKFTDQGVVTLGFRMAAENREFYVKDTGRGISAAKLGEIFKIFTQEETSLTRGYEGSGLGLAIAKGVAELLGGEINAISEKGKGSEFTFSLPPYITENEIKVKLKETTAKVKRKKPLVLVAEDDHINFLYLETVLRRAGCDYIHASNGAIAVELCRENPSISFVLMDIKMPVMNGLEATRIIKEFSPALPVIALTAYAQTGDKQRILDAGCDEYYAKPVTPDLLNSLIEKHIV
jgi:signal transduction histidine kinase/CheY-like chemotaxis protein